MKIYPSAIMVLWPRIVRYAPSLPLSQLDCISVLPLDIPPPSIILTDPPVTAAGDFLMLSCNVSTISGLVVHPLLQWFAPDGSIINSARVEESTVNTAVVSTLRFESIHTSHGGQYGCSAEISIPGAGLLAVDLKIFNVTVGSKSTAYKVTETCCEIGNSFRYCMCP